MHTKTEGNTFTKEIGQTVYGVRYYFNEDAKETNLSTQVRTMAWIFMPELVLTRCAIKMERF